MDVVADFERHQISCWISGRDVTLGGAYQAEVVDAINQCRAMLLLFSEAANKSEHVLREVELAAQARKPIYPLRIDSVEPAGGLKYMLANKQWVERRALGDRLVATIEQLLRPNERPAAGAAPATPPRAEAVAQPIAKKPASKVWIAAALAGVIAVGAAAWWAMKPAPINHDATNPARESGEAKSRTSRGTDEEKKRESSESKVAAKPEHIDIARSAPTAASALGTGRHFFQECEQCPVMAVVPAGSGMIGSPGDEPGRTPSEGPLVKVNFAQAFAVSRSEITFDEWFACVAEGGCGAFRPGDYGWGAGRRPVINVSWNDAKTYLEWLSRKTGATYRLLSEAEWEYAARGCAERCAQTAFWFGNSISPEQANYDWRYSYDGSPKAQALRKTVDATTGNMNAFGLLNVHGNVREWVEDCWNQTLAGLPSDGTARHSGDCQSRVVRGGSWADEPKELRSAARNWDTVGDRRAEIGFRVARTLSP